MGIPGTEFSANAAARGGLKKVREVDKGRWFPFLCLHSIWKQGFGSKFMFPTNAAAWGLDAVWVFLLLESVVWLEKLFYIILS